VRKLHSAFDKVKDNVASISNTKRLTWRLGAWVRRALISYRWSAALT
jgi:hypothetical protein